jgi:hypothetical protein
MVGTFASRAKLEVPIVAYTFVECLVEVEASFDVAAHTTTGVMPTHLAVLHAFYY